MFDLASIKKRGNYWQARVDYYDHNHKRHFKNKSGFATKREAQVWATEKENQLNKGFKINKDTVVFTEYFKEWYETFKEPKLSPVTQNRYKIIMRVLNSYFGKTLFKDISRSAYQKFINEYGKNHAKSTVLKVNAIIRGCVHSAIYDEIIFKDFTQKITITFDKNRDVKVDYLNINEIKQLTQHVILTRNKNFTSKYMILTALLTGARLGEIQALTWKDIDVDDCLITINKSWDANLKKFKPAKTESSNRTIKAPTQLINILLELNHGQKMIFENQYQTIPTSNAVNKTLRECLSQLNIKRKNFHFHSLRHSHVAFLLSQGIDLYVISQRLGHSNMTTTAKIYAYLIDEYKQKSDDKIVNQLQSIL